MKFIRDWVIPIGLGLVLVFGITWVVQKVDAQRFTVTITELPVIVEITDPNGAVLLNDYTIRDKDVLRWQEVIAGEHRMRIYFYAKTTGE